MSLSFGLCSLRISHVFLQQLACGHGHGTRQLDLHVLGQRFAFRRQRDAQRSLDLLAVLVSEVLGQVGSCSALDGGSKRRLPDHLSDLRVLHSGHMGSDMRLVVLVQERLHRLLLQHGHVLGDRVHRLDVFRQLDDLAGVLNTQNTQHLLVQFTHVVQLWGLLSQLQGGLVLHDPLRHCSSVRVRHGDDVHTPVEVFLAVRTLVHLVGVLFRHVVVDHPGEDAELVLHGSVQAGLDARHNFQAALQQGQRRPHRGLRAHISNLDVGHGADPTAFLDHVTKQLVQDAARLLIRHREQALAQRTPGHIGIAPLTRHKRSVISLDTQALGLQTSRQVRQRTRVDQLTKNRRSRLGEATDQVDEARAVEAHTREIRIVHEVHHLPLPLVLFLPVVSDG